MMLEMKGLMEVAQAYGASLLVSLLSSHSILHQKALLPAGWAASPSRVTLRNCFTFAPQQFAGSH